MSDGDDAVGRDIVGQAERLDGGLHPVVVRVAGRPHGAQSQGLGRQQEVLSGGGAVGCPVLVGAAVPIGRLSANDNDDRSLGNHFVKADGQFLLGLRLGYHHKTPGLDILPGRGRHGCPQQGFYLFGHYGFIGIGTNALSGVDIIKHSLAARLLLGKSCH